MCAPGEPHVPPQQGWGDSGWAMMSKASPSSAQSPTIFALLVFSFFGWRAEADLEHKWNSAELGIGLGAKRRTCS